MFGHYDLMDLIRVRVFLANDDDVYDFTENKTCQFRARNLKKLITHLFRKKNNLREWDLEL